MDFADFHFERPWLLALGFVVAALLFVLLRWSQNKRQRSLATFAAERHLTQLIANFSAPRRLTKDIALALAAWLMMAALAGPRWGREISSEPSASEDVVFVLDVSKSMLVADMRPNRLTRAKASIANFIKRKGTGNVGLVAFAGQAFLQCPLTRDYDAFFRTLDETDTASIQVSGTDIGRAIEEAELAFSSGRNRKLVIILTDGEDLEAGGVEAAKKLSRKGLVIHAVGVGTAAGGPINIITPLGAIESLKNSSGEEVLSRLDESTLQKLAESTGGRFVRLGQAGEGMESLRLAIQAGTDALGSMRQGIPREEWFLSAVLFLLIGESLYTTRRRPRP
ncbi:MAG: VWA domain-containing protein [Opitutales bacterium]|nr:MAG: VWA domain-containing protein [Opitutales bacterium]